VLEAENPDGEPFFEKRLMEAVSSYSGKPLDETLDGILSEVLEFSGSGQFGDDVCLLGVDLTTTPPSPV
jgi:serine phosphatase RsbU (regulator of sigma subunit)